MFINDGKLKLEMILEINGRVMYERRNKCSYVEYLKIIFIYWNYAVYVEHIEEINEKNTFIKYFS